MTNEWGMVHGESGMGNEALELTQRTND